MELLYAILSLQQFHFLFARDYPVSVPGILHFPLALHKIRKKVLRNVKKKKVCAERI